MTREKLEKYKKAFEILDDLMDEIKMSGGESWWQLPCVGEEVICEYTDDMGYVFEFWSDLRSYLFEDVEG